MKVIHMVTGVKDSGEAMFMGWFGLLMGLVASNVGFVED